MIFLFIKAILDQFHTIVDIDSITNYNAIIHWIAIIRLKTNANYHCKNINTCNLY